MTKAELKRQIMEDEMMLEAILPLSDGQDCLIFKAQEFPVSDEIIYIPDVWENNLDILNSYDDDDGISYAQRVVDNCYTGRDFIAECDGDVELLESKREFTRIIPVYMETAEYANENDELEVWQISHQTNIACKDAIETAIREGFDGTRLTAVAKDVLAKFGQETSVYPV